MWTTRPDGVAQYSYRGLDGLRSGLGEMREAWAEMRGETLETVESDDAVVSVIRWHQVEVVESWVSWIRDGKVTRTEQYGSKAEALEAAGLSE